MITVSRREGRGQAQLLILPAKLTLLPPSSFAICLCAGHQVGHWVGMFQ